MRFLGIGVLVALVASALGAGSALAKTPFTPYTWGQFTHCPYENTELTDCFYGATNGGKTGGFFEYGRVQVKLTKPIVIQGGFKGVESNVEVAAPTDGAGLLESPEEPVTKGLKVITKTIQNEAEWPEALKVAFNEAVQAKETKATATVELAGNECTTVPGCLNTESLIFEEPTPPAFRLPLKVTVKSPFLEKLGGGPCTIGSDELPIQQHLVSSGPGRAGDIEFNEPFFTVTEIKNSKLTDTNWHISKAQGAKGCGGEYEAYVNRALNIALEVEFANGFEPANKGGITVLTGSLFDGASRAVKKAHEAGEL
jgi:hypothetical protein